MLEVNVQQAHRAAKDSLYDDSVLADRENKIFIVADGIGSHPLPDEASSYATLAAYNFMVKSVASFRSGSVPENNIPDYLALSVKSANEVLFTLSEHTEGFATKRGDIIRKRAGTTLSMCYIHNNILYCSYAGDSPMFGIRNGECQKLTVAPDVQRDETAEKLNALAGLKSLSSYVGKEEDIEPRTMKYAIQAGDIIIMATDGLSDMLYDHQIGQVAQSPPFETSAQRLLNAASYPMQLASVVAKREGESIDKVMERIRCRDAVTVLAIKVLRL
jgi:PPM family protein phosphatase